MSRCERLSPWRQSQAHGPLLEGYVLGVEVFVDAFVTAFAAEAGFFHAAEGGGGVGDDAAVDTDHAGFESVGDP